MLPPFFYKYMPWGRRVVLSTAALGVWFTRRSPRPRPDRDARARGDTRTAEDTHTARTRDGRQSAGTAGRGEPLIYYPLLSTL